MKKFVGLRFSLVILTGCVLTGCTGSRKAAAKNAPVETTRVTAKSAIAMETVPVKSSRSSKPEIKPSENYSSEKSLSALQFKYAILLDVPIEEITDQKLFSFIDSWYGTPYRFGGFTKEGIDCSGFTQNFMATIYSIQVPRVSSEQYNQSKRISRRELREGDLVFFKTSGRSISHVGIYLRNNKFVHASTSSGVMISDLDDDYFARRFAGSGRVK